jgi:hypothetical protein
MSIVADKPELIVTGEATALLPARSNEWWDRLATLVESGFAPLSCYLVALQLSAFSRRLEVRHPSQIRCSGCSWVTVSVTPLEVELRLEWFKVVKRRLLIALYFLSAGMPPAVQRSKAAALLQSEETKSDA